MSKLTRRGLLTGATASAAGLPFVSPFAAHSLVQGEEPVRGGTLTYGGSPPVRNIINPLNSSGTGQNVLIEALFLRLVYGRQWGDGMNPDLTTGLDLAVAETMTEIEQDRVWEFTLRQNVLWHDGVPVTADDVIFGVWLSLNRNVEATNETPVVGLKGGDRLQAEGAPVGQVEVEGITKLGEYAIRIELEQATPNYWVDWAVGYWPMPKHIFGEMPFDQLFAEPYATMPIGNGPFKAVRYVDGQYMEMEANDDFYLGRPNVDRYIVRFGDTDTLSAALEAGEIDGMNVSAGPIYDRLSGLPYIVGNAVATTLPSGFFVNAANVPAPQVSALHRAIMHAVDVPTLNEQLFSGTLRPSNYVFEHIFGFEQPPAGFEHREYDPERAREILAEAGWDAGNELRWLLWRSPQPVNDAVQAMLADVGIAASYRVIDVAAITDELYLGDEWDLIQTSLAGDQSFASIWPWVKCGSSYEQGGWNIADYCNPDVDALWAEGLAEEDPSRRKEIFDQITMLWVDDPPMAMLWRGSVAYLWNTRVRGAYPYQYRLPVRPALERVWLANEDGDA